MARKAVILFNLGGPDSAEAIEPFLFNFFMDKNIIRLPYPLRWLVAKGISKRRSKREAGTSYGELGGKSPLLENTQAQAAALESTLGKDYKVFTCMRYWHPMAEEVAQALKEYDAEQIFLLPLYPQYSTTTTRSSFQSWDKAARQAGISAPTAKVCCYPMDEGFINGSADLIRAAYEQALGELDGKDVPAPRLLFSAHGLPEDVIRDGDPYQWQCEQSAAAIAEKVGVPMLDWVLCYQSRVGPKKWIGPSTEDALMTAAADGVPVIIYPHAFVSEHVETLVEIEIEYRELAEKSGVPYFARVETVGTNPAFISGLAQMVKNVGQLEKGYCCQGGRVCPAEFGRCAQQAS